MKKFALLGMGLALVTSGALAGCPSELYGKWVVSHVSLKLDSELQKEDFPLMWTFTQDGKATIDMPPFLNSTNDFECSGSNILIKKNVPTTLNIIRIDGKSLVWKEEGDSKYFYFSKN